MPWLQLHIPTDKSSAGELEDALLALGAVSVTLSDDADEPILEPGVGETPLWQAIKVTALFETSAERSDIEQALALPDHLYGWEILEDQPWERAWMEHFHPIQCGQRLWICPSWQDPPDPKAVNLVLDPGLAFGSGTHPTTFLCLQWLDGLELAGKTVVDYGCGSGILGIAALLLGAKKVIAIDNDPQALLATQDNLTRNGLTAESLETCLPRDIPPIAADVVVANILAEPLIHLADNISELCQDGGVLCLSGILASQASIVAEAYPRIHFAEPVTLEDWARLNGNKLL